MYINPLYWLYFIFFFNFVLNHSIGRLYFNHSSLSTVAVDNSLLMDLGAAGGTFDAKPIKLLDWVAIATNKPSPVCFLIFSWTFMVLFMLLIAG